MKLLALLMTTWTLQIGYSKPAAQDGDSEDKSIKPGDYPYHVFIRLTHGQKYPECEAALLHNNWILTSAACGDKFKSDPKSLEVVAGATSTANLDSDKNIQVRSILKIVIHPNYNASAASEDKGTDLALMKTGTPFRTNEWVKVPSFGGYVFENELYRFVSYGDSEDLQVTMVVASSKMECEENFSGRDFTKGLFCVKEKEYQSYMYGEEYAGAPLAHINDSSHHIYGISTSTMASIFTLIQDYIEWIESTTGQPSRTTASTTPAPTTTYAASTFGSDSETTESATSTPSPSTENIPSTNSSADPTTESTTVAESSSTTPVPATTLESTTTPASTTTSEPTTEKDDSEEDDD